MIIRRPSFSEISGGLPIYCTPCLLTLTIVLTWSGTGLQVSGKWHAFGGTVAETLSWPGISAAETVAGSTKYPANKMVITRFMRTFPLLQRPNYLMAVRPSVTMHVVCPVRSINFSLDLVDVIANR